MYILAWFLGPDWASTTLGIYICLRCAGIHRSLGVHVSFVRSLTMDDWTTKEIATMKRVGNLKARIYYEANKPENITKPSESDNVEIVRSYIIKKYVEKAWAPKDIPPPHVVPKEKKEKSKKDEEKHVDQPEVEKKTKPKKSKSARADIADEDAPADEESDVTASEHAEKKKKTKKISAKKKVTKDVEVVTAADSTEQTTQSASMPAVKFYVPTKPSSRVVSVSNGDDDNSTESESDAGECDTEDDSDNENWKRSSSASNGLKVVSNGSGKTSPTSPVEGDGSLTPKSATTPEEKQKADQMRSLFG